MFVKPMLAHKIDDIQTIAYPVLASPKLDGIRCLIVDGVAMSRNMKPIQNEYIRSKLAGLPDFDGELIVGSPTAQSTFNITSSGVMAQGGEPNFVYYIFDIWSDQRGFKERYETTIRQVGGREKCLMVRHTLIEDADDLMHYERDMLAAGFEGVMVRSLDGRYKNGRSTAREGLLGKVKRFEDSEAVVVGFEERMHNANTAIKDELGRTKRSSHKAGKVAVGTLGALKCVTKEGVDFDIGTGFDDAERARLWGQRQELAGRIVKFKHQPTGAKDAPRFPVFLGFRDAADL